MKAVCLITATPAQSDAVADQVRLIRGVKDVLVVAGRADVVAVFGGSPETVAKIIGQIEAVKGVQTNETLVELMG